MRGRPVINTPEFIAAVRALWDAGLPPAVIGGRTGRTAWAVSHIARLNGFPKRKPGSKPPPESLVEAVRWMRAAGITGADITAALGVGTGTARGIAQREGMPLLRRGLPAKADRNAAIRKLRAAGITGAEIAARFSISRQRVSKIAQAGSGAEKPA